MSFDALKISDHVYWVGAIDWTLRDFHGYTTEQGTTYNAYLIVGEQTILVSELPDEDVLRLDMTPARSASEALEIAAERLAAVGVPHPRVWTMPQAGLTVPVVAPV